MSASTQDKITDTRNSARPVSTTVSSSRSAGGTTLSCLSLTGWPTASKVHGVTYQIDSNSNPVAGTQIDFYAIRSGSDLISFTVVDGNDTGNSIGDIVEMLPTAGWGQDLSDGLMVVLNRDGSLRDDIVDTQNIAPDAVTADEIEAGAVGSTELADDAATAPKVSGVDKSNLTVDSNPYKFRVSRNGAANTGNGSAAVIAFDTEQYDTNSNVAAGVYTAPVSGFYHFNWGSLISNSGAATTTYASLFINGVEYSNGNRVVSTNVTVGSGGSDTVQMTVGDTADIRAFGTSAQPLSVGTIFGNYFSGHLVSRT